MNRLDGLHLVLCFPVEDHHVRQIQEAAPECQVTNAGQSGIAAAILHADIFCGHAKVPVPWPQVVQQGRLRWIQSSAAGLDHCLVPEVIASEILVSSASGLFADQVAEQTLALLLGYLRSMPAFYAAQQRREFERLPTQDLHGKTVGIIGFGGNGRRIAEVLSTLKVRILATDRFPLAKPPYVESLVGLDGTDEVLSESDVVILCVPLNAQTLGWFNADRLQRMRRGSVLVNVARGPVVVESDLVHALKTGHLSGAALDVTEVEPLAPSSPLWELPQVVITPHVGAQAADRVDVTVDFFCENLKRYREGQMPWNSVDKALGFPRPEHHQGLRSLNA